jgi:predicted O-methyltransferase YrrM
MIVLPKSKHRGHRGVTNDYEFTVDWLSGSIPTWQQIFSNRSPPDRVLEIGSYEGRSAVWIIENLLAGRATSLVAIDAWKEGGEAYQKGMTQVESRFDRNMLLAGERHSEVTITKRKGNSAVELATLLASGGRGSFDLIYIDAHHHAPDVLTDLVLSFVLCKVGGLIFCDDYLWSQFRGLVETPKLAIDSFTTCFHKKVRLIENVPLYQLYMYKIAE